MSSGGITTPYARAVRLVSEVTISPCTCLQPGAHAVIEGGDLEPLRRRSLSHSLCLYLNISRRALTKDREIGLRQTVGQILSCRIEKEKDQARELRGVLAFSEIHHSKNHGHSGSLGYFLAIRDIPCGLGADPCFIAPN